MADALKRLVGPVALGTSATTVYTAPGGGSASILDIQVCNESGSTVSFTLSVGTDGAGKRLHYQEDVASHKSFQRTGNIHIDAGEVLQAYASAGTSLTLTISGIETT